MIKDISIEEYTSNQFEDLWKLYESSNSFKLWPVKKEKFLNILSGEGDINDLTKIFVAKDNSEIIGYLVCKYSPNELESSTLVLIIIKKEYEKKGTGKELLTKLETFLKSINVKKIALGNSYLWPGIPENLNCKDFFIKNGFVLQDEMPVDMARDTSNWTPPSGIYDCLDKYGVKIEFSNKEVAEDILDVLKKDFSDYEWYKFYKRDFDEGKYNNVFYAHKDKEIIAVSELWYKNCTWDLLFENNVGGGAVLGVVEDWRGKGIGLAMKTWGTERVKEMGAKYIYIGWTYEIDFYKRLGFEVWRRYYRGYKSI
ncbi:GNAT family N-acetyltransferase [Candidatus Dojkabacteria bacterium]|jgi:GNAT superfamily N-acetyltransferase|nr:GNAT family N-acetyltransferase [Candidatus Dojkabacteria bacterium]